MLSAKRPSSNGETSERKQRLMKEVRGENEKKRINVLVEPELYERLRRKVFEERTTISDVTRDFWVDYVSR